MKNRREKSYCMTTWKGGMTVSWKFYPQIEQDEQDNI